MTHTLIQRSKRSIIRAIGIRINRDYNTETLELSNNSSKSRTWEYEDRAQPTHAI
jgi:hypothetical protein